MPIDKNLIRPFAQSGARNVLTKNIDKVNKELLLTLNETTQAIQNEKCKDSVPFIIWNDFLNKNGTLAAKHNRTYNRYVWGDKVFIDFGMTNIQTELSYPHPAIILYNYANTVIVAPTTTDDKVTAFTDDIEQSIIKVKSDGAIFPNDTIINLHQICSVHKERIISNLHANAKNFIIDDAEVERLNSYEKFKVFQKNINLLECIRIKLISIIYNDYMSNTFINEAYNTNMKMDLQAKVQELENRNAQLEIENCNLKSKNEELESENQDLKKSVDNVTTMC